MKKKIRDLTLEEINKICRHGGVGDCDLCPIGKIKGLCGTYDFVSSETTHLLDIEIEVKE